MSGAGVQLGELQVRAARLLDRLSQPDNARRVRTVVIVLLLIWTGFALAQLFWAWYPQETPAGAPADARILNPPAGAAASSADTVDIDALVALHLFGTAQQAAKPDAAAIAAARAEEEARARREGIEENARDTRLKLVLRGVVAATAEGEGHAIIEHQKKQAVYKVEDKLPVSGRVTLAKVLPDRVVLNNAGTYELLKLFKDDPLSAQVQAVLQAPVEPESPQEARDEDLSQDPMVTELARGYRDRLYSNPQSLAEVVRVSAVRGQDGLRGYRIAPGTDADQFRQLGFRNGDIVTGINGVELDNPGKAMQLYQTLRTATEASFTVERKGEPLTLTVSLDDSSG